MRIEFDGAKDEANRRKHGFSLADAAKLDFGAALILPDDRQDYGEKRFRAYGFIEGRMFMLAFALRGGDIRAISLRKANAREQKRYDARQ